MRRLRLRRYRRAGSDVAQQVAYYVDQGKVGTTGPFIDALEKAFRRLSQMPELGPLGRASVIVAGARVAPRATGCGAVLD